MLRPGDRVFVSGTGEEGYVREVHTQDVVVRLLVSGGYDERSYTPESLRFAPLPAAAARAYAH